MPLVELLTPLLGVLAVLVVAELFVLSRMRGGGRQQEGDDGADGASEESGKDQAEPSDHAEASPADDAAPPTTGDGATAADGDGEGPDPLDLTYVARIVTREDGEHVGESLCLAGDRVIVKADEGFLAVPVANVAESGEDLVARDVDWDRAKSLGGDWAKDNHDPIEFDDEGMPRR